MSEEQQANGLTGTEGAPSTVSATPVPPQEPTPQYLTRDELSTEVGRLRQEMESLAREQGSRGAQSFVDKARLNERVASTEKMLARMVQDGVLDQTQVSAYQAQARLEALTDLLPDTPEPPKQAEPPRQQRDPDMEEADRLVKDSGLTPSDPEYAGLFNHPNRFAWYEALQRAKQTKAARLARQQAQASVPTPASAPAAVPPTPSIGAMQDIGGAGAPVVAAEELIKQLKRAVSRNDYASIERINLELSRRQD